MIPATAPQHDLVVEDSNSREVLYACTVPGCGRRFVLHVDGRRTILERGEPMALHRAGLSLAVSLGT